MQIAITLAKKSFKNGDIPVGAVVVQNNKIVGVGYNKKEITKDASSHAEINALRCAAKKLNTYHLEDCSLYTTLEPCPMCAGAIINFRIKEVYIGAKNNRFGCCGSKINLLNMGFNHKSKVHIGIMEEECSKLLTKFFKNLRKKTF